MLTGGGRNAKPLALHGCAANGAAVGNPSDMPGGGGRSNDLSSEALMPGV